MVNGIKKGKAGEREAGKWLQKQFNLAEQPHRNLDQTREGGYDLLNFEPFAIEVKRQETLSKSAWWRQITKACPESMCAVVMYRQNRKKWKFMVPARLIGVPGYMELEAKVFIDWVNHITKELGY